MHWCYGKPRTSLSFEYESRISPLQSNRCDSLGMVVRQLCCDRSWPANQRWYGKHRKVAWLLYGQRVYPLRLRRYGSFRNCQILDRDRRAVQGAMPGSYGKRRTIHCWIYELLFFQLR